MLTVKAGGYILFAAMAAVAAFIYIGYGRVFPDTYGIQANPTRVQVIDGLKNLTIIAEQVIGEDEKGRPVIVRLYGNPAKGWAMQVYLTMPKNYVITTPTVRGPNQLPVG